VSSKHDDFPLRNEPIILAVASRKKNQKTVAIDKVIKDDRVKV
jgi:hypothetical protein